MHRNWSSWHHTWSISISFMWVFIYCDPTAQIYGISIQYTIVVLGFRSVMMTINAVLLVTGLGWCFIGWDGLIFMICFAVGIAVGVSGACRPWVVGRGHWVKHGVLWLLGLLWWFHGNIVYRIYILYYFMMPNNQDNIFANLYISVSLCYPDDVCMMLI